MPAQVPRNCSLSKQTFYLCCKPICYFLPRYLEKDKCFIFFMDAKCPLKLSEIAPCPNRHFCWGENLYTIGIQNCLFLSLQNVKIALNLHFFYKFFWLFTSPGIAEKQKDFNKSAINVYNCLGIWYEKKALCYLFFLSQIRSARFPIIH